MCPSSLSLSENLGVSSPAATASSAAPSCAAPSCNSEFDIDFGLNSTPNIKLNENSQSTKKSNDISYKQELARWAVDHNISQRALSSLLQINRKHNFGEDLPLDARTLLKTPRETLTVPVDGGAYYHIGVLKAIRQLLRNCDKVVNGMELQLQLNMDGIPVYSSTSSSLWPILGRIVNMDLNDSVFAIGAFYGASKPGSVDEYLSPFIDEYLHLKTDGMTVNGHEVTLKIHTIMCDAPARAQVKCVTQFSGYFGCDKCTLSGDYKHGSVKFVEPKPDPDIAPSAVVARENHIFHTYVGHAGHHRGRSPFLRTEVGELLLLFGFSVIYCSVFL